MTGVYSGLRDLAFRTTSADAGASPDASGEQPYAVVTDMVFPKGYATVVAMAGGAASIYLSGGGGYIGGGDAHATIRDAAKHAVKVAGTVLTLLHRTTEYPLPKSGNVTFYVLTKDGAMSASITEKDVQNSDHGLGALYTAVQDIVTQYRLANS